MQSGTIFYDFHCHDGSFELGVVKLVSLPEREFRSAPLLPGVFYSLQLHPWHAPELTHSYCELARSPKALALGEIGLDKRCTTPFAAQQKAFSDVLDLAESLQKPVVIHCVAAWSELFSAVSRRKLPCKLLHGFHGSPELLKQLIRHGFVVSFSPDAWQKPALQQLLREDPLIRALCVPERELLSFRAGKESNQRKGGLSSESAPSADIENSGALHSFRAGKENNQRKGGLLFESATPADAQDADGVSPLPGCHWDPESALAAVANAKPFTAGSGLALLLSLFRA